MKLSIYLHKEIADTLRLFGDLSYVTNLILQYGAEGYYDVCNKPAIVDRGTASRYMIDVTEPNYLQLLAVHSSNSPKISLRRLLYWFVENEMYNEVGMTISKYKDIRTSIHKIIEQLNTMKEEPERNAIINKLKEAEEIINGSQCSN